MGFYIGFSELVMNVRIIARYAKHRKIESVTEYRA